MKHHTNFIVTPFFLLLTLLLFFANCRTTEEEKPNKAPTCNITNPADNDIITLGATVKITVSATDGDGTISNVKISIDGTTVATLQTSPYTYDWNTTGAATGSHIIKAVATDDGGLTAMSQVTVELTAQAPTVTTGDVTDITNESAKCSGEVTDDGGDAVTARGFVWSTSATPTLEDNEGSVEVGNGTGIFTATISGLMPFTEYYVRAYATNSTETSYGDAKLFKTLQGPPVVVTVAVADIAAHAAFGRMEVVSDGGDDSGYTLRAGIVWSKNPNPVYDPNNIDNGSTFEVYFHTGNPAQYPGANDVLLSALEENTTYYYRAFAENSYGVGYGDEETLTTMAFAVETGDFTDARDSKTYKTVTISGQRWMAENLAYLPQVCPPDTECGYWVYDYQGSDVAAAKATANYADYGVLYNWETAQSVCPSGWHLPANEEWTRLELNLGMKYSDAMADWLNAYRGLDEGAKLKDAGNVYWESANGNNIAQFNARGAGMRSISSFFGLRQFTFLWTSSVDGNFILYRALENNSSEIGTYKPNAQTNPDEKKYGYSVRCVSD